MEPSEYDIAYSMKEWLIKHKWNIAGFDPPGAQGTFSIPNPSKEKGYKGQTGTESPDIIAIKNNFLLIVESKDFGDSRITEDVIKLRGFLKNQERMDIFEKIVVHACKANNISFKFDKSKIILSKAHGGKKILGEKDIETFHVKINRDWNPTSIDPTMDLSKIIIVKYYPTSENSRKILED